MSIDFCAEVAECINNSTAVKDAINQYLRSAAGQDAIKDVMGDTAKEFPRKNENLVSVDCNLNNLYGRCVALVDFLHDSTVDFFEIVETWTQNQEIVSGLIAAIPAIETLPLDEILTLGDKFRDVYSQYYLASFTQSLRNEMICDLFCLGKNSCNITLEMAAEYFYDKFKTYFPFSEGSLENLSRIINILTELSAGQASVLVYAMYSAHLGLVNALSRSFGFDASILYYNTLLGIDSDDHLLLCPTCVDDSWIVEVDLKIANGGFTVSSATNGVWVSGTGWIDGQSGNVSRCYPVLDLIDLTNVTKIEMEFRRTGTHSAGFRNIQTQKNNEAWVSRAYLVNNTQYPDNSLATTGDFDADITKIWLNVNSSGGYTDIRITKCRIYGTGAIPTKLTQNGWTQI